MLQHINSGLYTESDDNINNCKLFLLEVSMAKGIALEKTKKDHCSVNLIMIYIFNEMISIQSFIGSLLACFISSSSFVSFLFMFPQNGDITRTE